VIDRQIAIDYVRLSLISFVNN